MQIVWGHSRKAIKWAKRTGSPLLIFPHFWTKNEAAMNWADIDRSGLDAYYPNPVNVRIVGGRILADYGTDVFDVTVSHEAKDELLDKVLMFEPSDRQEFLWDRSVIVDMPDRLEYSGEVEIVK
jgi:hypothetical protein